MLREANPCDRGDIIQGFVRTIPFFNIQGPTNSWRKFEWMCRRCDDRMTSPIFWVFLQVCHIGPHSNGCMRIHEVAIGVINLLNNCLSPFIIYIGPCKVSLNPFEFISINSQLTRAFKIFHKACCPFWVFSRDVVEEALKVGGFQDIHRGRQGRIERTIHIVGACLEEVRQNIVLIGGTNHLANRNPHLLSIISS